MVLLYPCMCGETGGHKGWEVWGGIVLGLWKRQKERKGKKGKESVKAWSVSSTMVKRAFAFTFTQHAGDCERYYGG